MIQLGLASIPILVIVWALHLNADMEEKNNSLIQAGKRQEFLQQLTMTNTGSLEKESFLNDLLRGLREFVPWDRELLLVLPALNQEEPVLHSLGDLPPDPHGVKGTLVSMLENHALFKPNFASGASVRPLLDSDATSQVIIALATSEMAFGILVAERSSGPAFKEEDVRFLELAFAQIASHVQDEILKKQLLVTNRKLMRQTEYFSQILSISNLLRVHLDIQGILEKVAQGILEGIGFQAVLISLYHEEEGYFERIAQAGDDARWEEIRAVRPPAGEVLALLKEKYLVGRCYLIRHSEDMWTSFAVRPANPRPVVDLDDWHPEDLLIVPLVDKDERLLGIISVDEPTDGKVPSMETLRALEILANQTVHALETAQVHAQITRQAVIDGLTGLYNHGYFQEVLSAKAREHAEAHLPYAVLMLDLDNFKEVNDTYGHLAGDDMLRAVAEVLTASIRKEDVAARYGGEEFAVFLPRRTGEQAMPVAERIRAAVDQIRAVAPGEGAALRVTVSVGLAVYPEQGADHHQVLEQADLALYQAKHQGKNRVCKVS
jgi:diguanylate cyclase (GGDEF)-like protein